MMLRSLCGVSAFAAACALMPFSAAQAQSDPESDPPSREAPLHAEQNEDQPQPSLKADVGVGTFVAPAFMGSKDYQVLAIPAVSVRYKDRFFFSVADGLGFDLIRTEHLHVGPVLRYMPKRKEDGENSFRIAGSRSDALRGLGDVSATAEVGGFAEYKLDALTARIEVLKATAASKGVTANIGIKYNKVIPTASGRPIVLSIGPRTTIVNGRYNETYYGVTPLQSERSGLPMYKAGGGVLSAGVGASATVPVAQRINAFVFAGYDRMTGDAGRSPLVEERGSRNQGTFGLGLTYHFTAF